MAASVEMAACGPYSTEHVQSLLAVQYRTCSESVGGTVQNMFRVCRPYSTEYVQSLSAVQYRTCSKSVGRTVQNMFRVCRPYSTEHVQSLSAVRYRTCSQSNFEVINYCNQKIYYYNIIDFLINGLCTGG